MTRKTALTPDQVRQRFRQRGITLTQWAADHGYNREAVYRVINGKDKAYFGRAHEIAVALGLKVPEGEPSTAQNACNTQHDKAA